MSHIHLPDGVLPIGWVIVGYALTICFLFIAFRCVKGDDVRRKVPYIGVLAALMLLTMSVPLGFIPFHLNLAVLVGILAGPALGFITIFVVNILLSFLGHGGITVVGINTIIVGMEVVAGSFIFSRLRNRIPLVPGAAIAVVIALLLSTTMMLGVIGTATGQITAALPHQDELHEAAEDVVDAENKDKEAIVHVGEDLDRKEGTDGQLNEVHFLSFSGWGAIGIILFCGILLETVATGLIIGFFVKVRPDIIISPKR